MSTAALKYTSTSAASPKTWSCRCSSNKYSLVDLEGSQLERLAAAGEDYRQHLAWLWNHVHHSQEAAL